MDDVTDANFTNNVAWTLPYMCLHPSIPQSIFCSILRPVFSFETRDEFELDLNYIRDNRGRFNRYYLVDNGGKVGIMGWDKFHVAEKRFDLCGTNPHCHYSVHVFSKKINSNKLLN